MRALTILWAICASASIILRWVLQYFSEEHMAIYFVPAIFSVLVFILPYWLVSVGFTRYASMMLSALTGLHTASLIGVYQMMPINTIAILILVLTMAMIVLTAAAFYQQDIRYYRNTTTEIGKQYFPELFNHGK